MLAVLYTNIDSSGWVYIFNATNNTTCDFTVVNNTLNFSSEFGAFATNGNYSANYTVFPNNDEYNLDLQTTTPINVEILSERADLFGKRFMPLEPIAEVQFLGCG